MSAEGSAVTRNFVIMGVSGCGKSSIGAAFAQATGAVFMDGDDLHPQSNIAKMAAGEALDDDDRAPWLASVGKCFADHDGALVVGCSALKRSYRDVIRAHARGQVTFLHLSGSRAVIADRMSARSDHFMPLSLLDSQFAALEPLGADENAVTVDIDQAPEMIVRELLGQVAL
ncbi:gluconokinase [Yoonia sp. BS5-3]|uniref:Gluconokinase n=1 Tax=Yoonia phaeophyticola TaxID=3137369 RepID=A0ABZ2V7V7_9RHOB